MIEKIVRGVRKKGQQPMLEIKWLWYKITSEEPIGNIKVDQPLMVEQFYRNKKYF